MIIRLRFLVTPKHIHYGLHYSGWLPAQVKGTSSLLKAMPEMKHTGLSKGHFHFAQKQTLTDTELCFKRAPRSEALAVLEQISHLF